MPPSRVQATPRPVVCVVCVCVWCVLCVWFEICVLFVWVGCVGGWCCWWSWCVFGVRHAEKLWKKTVCELRHAPVCTFKTSPCAPAPRPHVFSTCARGAGTHGDVLNVHRPSSNKPHTHAKKDKNERKKEEITASSAYQNLPTKGYHVPQRFTK